MLTTLKGRKRPVDVTLSYFAYQTVRDAILKGDFPFGTVFSRRKIAAQLGMSILPVSEALQRLENEGLVTSQPRVGTTVRMPTPQELRGLYIVREALECQAARLVAEKASPQKLGGLLQMAKELDEKWKRTPVNGRTRDYLLDVRKRHMQFHLELADASDCPALRQAIEKNNVLLFLTMYDSLLGDQSEPPRWHQQLMKALMSKDPQKAETAMRLHVRNGLDLLLARLEPYLRWDESKFSKLSGSRQTRRERQH